MNFANCLKTRFFLEHLGRLLLGFAAISSIFLAGVRFLVNNSIVGTLEKLCFKKRKTFGLTNIYCLQITTLFYSSYISKYQTNNCDYQLLTLHVKNVYLIKTFHTKTLQIMFIFALIFDIQY